MIKSGRILANWDLRRRLLVPTLAPWGSSRQLVQVLEIKASNGFSRLVMMPMCSPSGRSAGTSFMLCTAMSTSLLSRASSISLTNSPLPPTFARGTSVILSPLVMIFTSSTMVSGYWASISPLIQVDWVRASRLALVPILINFCINVPPLLVIE